MRHRVLIGLAAIFLAFSVTVAVPALAAGPLLTVNIVQTSVWNTGYGATVAIVNVGDAASSTWTVEFDLPAGTTITNSWSSVPTGSGQHHTFVNAAYNGDIVPGAQESFGFNVSGLGLPYNCTVNGVPCSAGTPSPSQTTTPGPSSSPSPSPTPSSSPSPSPTGSGDVVDVATGAQLSTALAAAVPGQTIRLASGEYRGSFLARRSGTSAQPITLTGPRTAVLVNDGPSGSAPSCPNPTVGWDPGYGLWLVDAPHWNLVGFTVRDSKKGVVLDNSPHVTIDGLHVHHIDEEGVHFRRSSADGIIRNSVVEHTGLVQPRYGEGVYIGSAGSNWNCHGNSGGADRSDRVQVIGNRIGPYVAAEHVDVKEGTLNGVIRDNTFDGRGIAGQNSADSWVDVKGSGYVIENNTGTFAPPGTFANGYETHNPTTTPTFQNGCGNVWRSNSSDLGGVGVYAVYITSRSKCSGNLNVVYASNTFRNAASGLTNIPVTP
ncbi:Cellulose binding domain-containing protein [Micromonospora nigra]|uniref:Cellulose binding domain-containing protein n=1 Tax=Micromonospora nigra TaxID=145857 RepID=A0A1C6RCQ4_9ACTN|nr:cellulose binding domain-containing protein [Micromonospora nigra]SCL14865.1 Cellulose binding domain-containing protein [Micromonospora nigra]